MLLSSQNHTILDKERLNCYSIAQLALFMLEQLWSRIIRVGGLKNAS